MSESNWCRTVDFRPAPAGWRIVCWKHEPPHFSILPMPGWLIEELPYNDGLPDRHVIPSYLEEDSIQPIGSLAHFYCFLSPGEATPSEDDMLAVAAEMEARQAEK